jgi:hypothetical protein
VDVLRTANATQERIVKRMNKKLNDEEYHAFLQMFDGQSVQIRRLSTQSKIFRLSFRFVNIYSFSFICIFFLMTKFFADAINKDILTEGYVVVLSARAYISLWLLAGFNIAYYFSFYFRFFVVLMLMYLLNATIDQTLLFLLHYDYAQKPILAAFYLTRPFFIFALIVTLFKYDEQR